MCLLSTDSLASEKRRTRTHKPSLYDVQIANFLYLIGDLFKEAATRILRSDIKDGHLKSHDKAFVPAKVVREKPHLASYEHKSDLHDIKRSLRDAEGAVIIGPRNFFTTPSK